MLQPTDANLEAYLREFKLVNVTDIVRACECGYSTDRIIKNGVTVHVRQRLVAAGGSRASYRVVRFPLFRRTRPFPMATRPRKL